MIYTDGHPTFANSDTGVTKCIPHTAYRDAEFLNSDVTTDKGLRELTLMWGAGMPYVPEEEVTVG